MENGSPDGNEGGGALYAGGKIGWVKSAATISTSHNGTTLRDVIGWLLPSTAVYPIYDYLTGILYGL